MRSVCSCTAITCLLLLPAGCARKGGVPGGAVDRDSWRRGELERAIAVFRGYSLENPNYDGKSATSCHEDCTKARRAVREMGDSAVDALAGLLRDDSSAEVRYWVALCLTERRDDEVRDAFIHALGHDANPHVRYRAAQGLGFCNDAASHQALLAAFEREIGAARRSATVQPSKFSAQLTVMESCCWSFRRLKLAQAVPPVAEKYDVIRRHPSVLKEALRFLADTDTTESIAFLLEKAQEETSPDVLVLIAGLLGPSERCDVLPSLLRLADHGDFRVHAAATGSLARFPEERAIPALIRYVHRVQDYEKAGMMDRCGPSWLSLAPHAVLRKLTGRDFGPDERAWAQWWKAEGTGLYDSGSAKSRRP